MKHPRFRERLWGGCDEPTEVGAVVENGKIVTGDDLDVWEGKLEHQIETDASVKETDREALVRARRGQGLFKQRVMRIEARCRITGVGNPTQYKRAPLLE